MNQETLEKMRQTRLQGMYNAFKTSMESFKTESMTTDQFVAWLVSNEWDDRCNRMIERLIKQASFRYKASLEEVDYSLERGLERNLLERLAELSFVKESRDLFITGSSGTGKSYIATALGYRACQKGMKVLYANTASSTPFSSTHCTVPSGQASLIAKAASASVLPEALMAVYLGAPVGVALMTLIVTVSVISA